MDSWTCINRYPRRVYRRSLGINELGFYYDSRINGTADMVNHAVVEVPDGVIRFAEDNVARTWRSLKAQFPLLGATIRVEDSVPHFIVAEERLKTHVPDEISLSCVSSDEEARAAAAALINGARTLSDDLLCRIIILSRTDAESTFHVLFHAAHLITDGVGNSTVLKGFLDIISSPDKRSSTPDLEARLSLAIAAEALVPSFKMSVASQRWRRAAGHIISKIRDAKRIGGHTLPRRFGPVATRLPARSGAWSVCFFTTSFSPEDSLSFIQNCRKHSITFGNAYPVLAQAGLARVLCRRYVRGDIIPEEWEFRKKQPYHTAGPINLRPFLDKDWFLGGGQRNLCLSIGFFFYTLPFIPLGPSHLAPGDDLPELSALMSPKRFFMRCNIVKDHASRFLHRPLFFETGAARLTGKVDIQKDVAAKWENNPEAYVEQAEVNKHSVSAIEQIGYGSVMGHGGSSFGNADGLVPREYPIHKTGASARPLLYLRTSESLLHCRTGELYLGARTSGQQLHFIVYWDKNVFSEDLVREWVAEIQQATHMYLGGTQGLESKL
ncbi:hypothetical protein B0H10DRAFT_2350920 [Mycena sp. CBHHK59/15]|nr:hypothetical protein B0H10DRAFT_2350920 [Mycena sp. CBHHK59/15]